MTTLHKPDIAANELADMIHPPRLAMVCSRRDDGSLVAEPLTVLRVDADGTLWFMCAIADDAPASWAVNLTVGDEDNVAWLGISGNARAVRDPGCVHALRTSIAPPWALPIADDPSVALMAVTPTLIECWSSAPVRPLAGVRDAPWSRAASLAPSHH